MKQPRIVLLTRLTGSSLAKFPSVAWINGDRTKIASIEKNLRDQILEVAGIEKGDDLAQLSSDAQHVNIYALIGTRTLTAQVATDEQVAMNTGANAANNPTADQLGHVFPNPLDESQMLITVEPYYQDLVLKVSDTTAGLIDQLSGEEESAAWSAFEVANEKLAASFTKAVAAESLKAEQRAKLAELNAKRAALKAKELTGAPAPQPETENVEG